MPESLFFKKRDLLKNFIKKETLAQVFPCEFFEISKNTFLYKTPLVAASVSLDGFFLSDVVFHLHNSL